MKLRLLKNINSLIILGITLLVPLQFLTLNAEEQQTGVNQNVFIEHTVNVPKFNLLGFKFDNTSLLLFHNGDQVESCNNSPGQLETYIGKSNLDLLTPNLFGNSFFRCIDESTPIRKKFSLESCNNLRSCAVTMSSLSGIEFNPKSNENIAKAVTVYEYEKKMDSIIAQDALTDYLEKNLGMTQDKNCINKSKFANVAAKTCGMNSVSANLKYVFETCKENKKCESINPKVMSFEGFKRESKNIQKESFEVDYLSYLKNERTKEYASKDEDKIVSEYKKLFIEDKKFIQLSDDKKMIYMAEKLKNVDPIFHYISLSMKNNTYKNITKENIDVKKLATMFEDVDKFPEFVKAVRVEVARNIYDMTSAFDKKQMTVRNPQQFGCSYQESFTSICEKAKLIEDKQIVSTWYPDDKELGEVVEKYYELFPESKEDSMSDVAYLCQITRPTEAEKTAYEHSPIMTAQSQIEGNPYAESITDERYFAREGSGNDLRRSEDSFEGLPNNLTANDVTKEELTKYADLNKEVGDTKVKAELPTTIDANNFIPTTTPNIINPKISDVKSINNKNDKIRNDDIEQSNKLSNNQVDSKIDELNKKLAETESRLSKLKTEAADKETEEVAQKKIREENALISELRNQIKELKENKQEVKEKARNFNNYASTTGNSQGNYFSPKNENPRVEKYDSKNQNQAVTQNHQSAGQGSFSSGSSLGQAPKSAAASAVARSNQVAILTSQAQDVIKKEASSAGVMITKLDGMTKDVVQSTILKRISDMKGSSFYVEENGLIKEVIAEMKDGKVLLDEKGNPIYKVVELGKADDKKLVIYDKNKKPIRGISSQADLRKEQENQLKKQRAEYEKLKGLTRKVIETK